MQADSHPSHLTGAAEADYVKRVVGLPGDIVDVKGGILRKNGKTLKESYLLEPNDSRYGMHPVTVQKGTFFVLGDNLNNSNDSHVHGSIEANRIVGEAAVIWWPIGQMRSL